MVWIPGGVLTAPALLLAGGAASAHCALMCGALSAHQARAGRGLPVAESLLWLHTGRVLGYSLMGAAAGFLGQSLVHHLPSPRLGAALQTLAALALLSTGIYLLLRRPPARAGCCQPPGAARVGQWPRRTGLLTRGLLWALLPCGLLYAVLLLAALGGSAVEGALLAGAFALGGTPLLTAIGWRSVHRAGASRAAGWWLIVIGAAGLVGLWWLHSTPAAWCTAGML